MYVNTTYILLCGVQYAHYPECEDFCVCVQKFFCVTQKV